MSEARIGRRYAQALFELAEKEDPSSLDSYKSILNELASLFSEPEIGKVLHSPVVPAATKGEILKEILASLELDKLFFSFLDTVADAGRVSAIPAIASHFEHMLNEARGIVPTTVTTVFELNEAQKDEMRTKLENLVGKKVHLTNQIDKTILGGFKVSLGNSVLDMSLRSKLNAITDAAAL